MAKKLKSIMLNEISLVDNPANQHARVTLHKMDAGTPSNSATTEVTMTPEELEKRLGDAEAQTAELKKGYDASQELIKNIVKAAADVGVEIDKETGKVTKKAEPEYIEMDGEKVLKASVPEPLLKRLETLEKAHETETLGKRAQAELPNLAGTDAAKGQLLKAIDGLSDKEDLMKSLKAADAAVSKMYESVGKTAGDDENSATSQLNKMANEYATEKGVSFEKAYAEVTRTEKGATLMRKSMQEVN